MEGKSRCYRTTSVPREKWNIMAKLKLMQHTCFKSDTEDMQYLELQAFCNALGPQEDSQEGSLSSVEQQGQSSSHPEKACNGISKIFLEKEGSAIQHRARHFGGQCCIPVRWRCRCIATACAGMEWAGVVIPGGMVRQGGSHQSRPWCFLWPVFSAVKRIK